MQLVDFDLKRSHSMTSVVGKANYSVDPSHSMRAWEGGRSAEDMTRSKSQRISLDFKYEFIICRNYACFIGSTKRSFTSLKTCHADNN